MSAAAAAALRIHAPTARADPRWAIARHVARRSLRWALIWGAVFGVWVLSTVKAFVAGYPTLASRLQVARSLQSFALFMGVPRRAETVAGFVSWRLLVVVVVVGAIWGLMNSTGLLRGEEDAGRWELLLAGQTTKRWAVAQALVGFGIALAAMFGATALLTLVAGQLPGARLPVGGVLLFALAMVSGAAMFLAVGALTSQLAATRGQAATIAAVVLGASFVVRMVADSRTGLGWLRWLSPIGWVEELRPLQDPQPLALLPIVGLVAGCAAVALRLADGRDLHAAVLPERRAREGPVQWVVGPGTLATRLTAPSAAAWFCGIAAMAFVYGSLARSAATLLASSPAVTATLGRLGSRKAAESYLGIVFLMMAVLIAVVAAGQVGALRGEEASGRLDNLLVRPVGRTTWLMGRLAVAAAVVVATGPTAGLFTWLGGAGRQTGVSLSRLLETGVNAVVPALFVLGVGVLAFGLRPRVSAAVSYGVVAWSFLVALLGSVVRNADWLRDSSLFTHMALAPAANPTWDTAAVIVLLGVAAAAVGVAAFVRRDVEYE